MGQRRGQGGPWTGIADEAKEHRCGEGGCRGGAQPIDTEMLALCEEFKYPSSTVPPPPDHFRIPFDTLKWASRTGSHRVRGLEVFRPVYALVPTRRRSESATHTTGDYGDCVLDRRHRHQTMVAAPSATKTTGIATQLLSTGGGGGVKACTATVAEGGPSPTTFTALT